MPTPSNRPMLPLQPPTAPIAKQPPLPIPPAVLFEVTCIEVDSIETAVQVMEKVPDPANPKNVVERPHACVRRVYLAKFEHDPKPVTQPSVAVQISSLEQLPFEVKKTYVLSFS